METALISSFIFMEKPMTWGCRWVDLHTLRLSPPS